MPSLNPIRKLALPLTLMPVTSLMFLLEFLKLTFNDLEVKAKALEISENIKNFNC